MLKQFTDSIRHISEEFGGRRDRSILTIIPTRLRGDAFNHSGVNALKHTTVEEFIHELMLEFSGIQDMDILKMELCQVFQEEDEPVNSNTKRKKILSNV